MSSISTMSSRKSLYHSTPFCKRISRQDSASPSPIHPILTNPVAPPGGLKRRLDDSCLDETFESPIKRRCVSAQSCSPDEGCGLSFRDRSTPRLVEYSAPRSKVKQPLTAEASRLVTFDQAWKNIQGVPKLSWDREFSDVSNEDPVKHVGEEVTGISRDPCHVQVNAAGRPSAAGERARDETSRPSSSSLTHTQKAKAELGCGKAASLKSVVVVPSVKKCPAPSPPHRSEDDWQRQMRSYVSSVKRHMREKSAGLTNELDSLMVTVANQRRGSWQHPSDLTRSNFVRQSGGRVLSLHEWQKLNHSSHRRFSKEPDFFLRSSVD